MCGMPVPVEPGADGADHRAYHIIGGIGDILQSFDSARALRHVFVYSHYARALDLLRPLGIACTFTHFELETYQAIRPIGSRLPYSSYPHLEFPAPRLETREPGPIVGIHPFGSAFSNAYWSARGKPAKFLGREVLLQLLAMLKPTGTRVLLFCAPDEAPLLRALLPPGAGTWVVVVAEDDIWKSLVRVRECTAVIGVDSAIKAMSCILRIPTIVLLGDYADPFRDRHFIDPYVRDGVLQVIRFRRLSSDHIHEAWRSLAKADPRLAQG